MALLREHVEAEAIAILEAAIATINTTKAPIRISPEGQVAAIKFKNLTSRQFLAFVISEQPYPVQMAETQFDIWADSMFGN